MLCRVNVAFEHALNVQIEKEWIMFCREFESKQRRKWFTKDEIAFVNGLGTHTRWSPYGTQMHHPPCTNRRRLLEDYRRIALARPAETWESVDVTQVLTHVDRLLRICKDS